MITIPKLLASEFNSWRESVCLDCPVWFVTLQYDLLLNELFYKSVSGLGVRIDVNIFPAFSFLTEAQEQNWLQQFSQLALHCVVLKSMIMWQFYSLGTSNSIVREDYINNFIDKIIFLLEIMLKGFWACLTYCNTRYSQEPERAWCLGSHNWKISDSIFLVCVLKSEPAGCSKPLIGMACHKMKPLQHACWSTCIQYTISCCSLWKMMLHDNWNMGHFLLITVQLFLQWQLISKFQLSAVVPKFASLHSVWFLLAEHEGGERKNAYFSLGHKNWR